MGGQPIIFDRVKDAYCWDVDGNKYIDYVGSWGPAIVGHANDEVNTALKLQIEKGTSFGAPCELEVRHLERNLVVPEDLILILVGSMFYPPERLGQDGYQACPLRRDGPLCELWH